MELKPLQRPSLASPGSARLLTWLVSIYRAKLAYIFLAPALLLICTIIFYPIARTFLLSFSKVDALGNSKGFAGLQNYNELFSSSVFWNVTLQTIEWTVWVIVVTTLIAIPTALALNLQFPGRKIARGLLIIPWAASLMINAIAWRLIFDGQYSIITYTLLRLGLIKEQLIWLGTADLAFAVIIFVGIMVSIPFTTMSLLAGLQAIPIEQYEAASVDGAGFWIKFWHITIPNLRQPLIVTTLLNVIYVFNSFPIIWILTQGGPSFRTDILVTYLYKQAFRYNNFGGAAAMSVITFLILVLFASVFQRIVGRVY